VKSRDVLVRELRRAQERCSDEVSSIRSDLLARRSPGISRTAKGMDLDHNVLPNVESMIGRAHDHERVCAIGEWVLASLCGLEDTQDLAMGERFAEEALRMARASQGKR
jgi:hypothetical protein